METGIVQQEGNTAQAATAPAKKVRRRTPFSRYHFRPYRDWRILLFVTLCFFGGTVYYGYDLFSKVRAGDAFSIEQTKIKPGVGIDTEKLQDEVEYYRSRARSYQNFKAAPPVVSDPSVAGSAL